MNTSSSIKSSQSKHWQELMLVWALVCYSSSVSAQANYIAFEVPVENSFNRLLTEDLNGDGLADLAISSYREGVGRELEIFHQQTDGSFDPNPQVVEIKTEIIAVAAADLRPAPGKELILYAADAVYSLSTAIEGYAGNIKQLFEWNMIATIPNLEEVLIIPDIGDINNDGITDLLIPGDDRYGYFVGLGDERFELRTSFPTINEETAVGRITPDDSLNAGIRIDAEKGLVVELTASAPSPFSQFLEQYSDEDNDSGALLRSESWMPAASLVRLNEDERLDIAYINVGDDGLGQLNIHYQDQSGNFNAAPDWQESLETSGYLEFVDMNGDERVDLMRVSGDGNDYDARFFLNRQGVFDFQQPNQIMRFSGYDVRLDFISLEANTAPVLNVSYYTIPVVDVIRNASINRTQLFYGTDDVESGQLVNRRPASKFEESFSASNVRGLAGEMSTDFDIDGDGRKDALYITDSGTLAAKHINEELQIADEPFWEYVAPRWVFEYALLQLNGDNKPDLLLYHNGATTVLVTSP